MHTCQRTPGPTCVVCSTETLAMVEMVQYTPCLMRSKPDGWIVGSVTSDWLTTVADPEESHDALFELDGAMSRED